MPRGRKAIPTEIKRLRGNPGKRPLNGDEPKPDNLLPEPPPWMGPIATDMWRQVGGRMVLQKRWDSAHYTTLAAHCVAYEDYVNFCADIAKHGRYVAKPLTKHDKEMGRDKGVPMLNPAYKARAMASSELLRTAGELGLTPSSQTRIRVPVAPATPPPGVGKLGKLTEFDAFVKAGSRGRRPRTA